MAQRTESADVEPTVGPNPHLRTLRRIGIVLIVIGVLTAVALWAVSVRIASTFLGGLIVLAGVLVLTSITAIRAIRWER